MPIELIFVALIGGFYFFMEGLPLLCRLCTKRGRAKLKSWRDGEYVKVDDSGMMYRFDYHGTPTSMKWSPEKMREAIRKVRVHMQ